MKTNQKGQTLVVFAIAAMALIFFIGLAVDAGSLYVTYGQLKRAVDAAAVAAANEFKRQEAGHEADVIPKMTNAAVEILKLQNIDPNTIDLQIRLCDSNFDHIVDADLATVAPDFYDRCPDTNAGKQARKLIWVRATQEAPLYFLHMLGFSNIPLTTDAVSEAASVDLVLVFDTSESMGYQTPSYDGSDLNPDSPSGGANGCNLDNSCQPLLDAKLAAKQLIGNLYDGYDRVWIVTFDTEGVVRHVPLPGTTLQDAIDVIDHTPANDGFGIPLHDDAPFSKLFWKDHLGYFNPVNPEDSDDDGSDCDLPHIKTESVSPGFCVPDPVPSLPEPPIGDQRWDSTYGPEGSTCDLANYGGTCETIYDAFDTDGDGIFTNADNTGPTGKSNSLVSTCTGCGIRWASNELRDMGRTASVWVIVFLSDGMANMSDTPNTDSENENLQYYPNGFCRGGVGSELWKRFCVDFEWSPRFCIDEHEEECPPGTIWDFQGSTPSTNYTPLDYALDMTDEAALTKSLNLHEPGGNEISIYTIGLNPAGNDALNPEHPIGERLLRYMAAVGDDGDRETDPCAGVGPRQTCGQYYYAGSGGDLSGIFLDIASRIYTKISE
jgi:hypothetical protein